MPYKIFPSIGIARLGNSLTNLFVGSEIPGHPGLEKDSQGNEVAIKAFKVGDSEIKRQAVRFRIFEIGNDGESRLVTLQQGSTVEWTVHLVNKKDAVRRGQNPPPQPQRPQL